MQINEFIQAEKQLLDDFFFHYMERRKRGKEQTMFKPEDQWLELLEEFLINRRSVLIEEDQAECQTAA